MIRLLCTPQTDWSRKFKPFDLKDIELLKRTLAYDKLTGEKEIIVETSLKEDGIQAILDIINDVGMFVYIQTDIVNIIPTFQFNFLFHTLILVGDLHKLPELKMRFINPGCWYISYMSQFNDEHLDIQEQFQLLDRINCTRLFVIVNDNVPYVLRMAKVVKPGILTQIVYKEENYFDTLKQKVYAGN